MSRPSLSLGQKDDGRGISKTRCGVHSPNIRDDLASRLTAHLARVRTLREHIVADEMSEADVLAEFASLTADLDQLRAAARDWIARGN